MNTTNPVELLRGYDTRLRALARPMPGGKVDQGMLWRGISFRLANENLVASMEQIVEVLTNPLVSRVPGAKPWVRGVTNVEARWLLSSRWRISLTCPKPPGCAVSARSSLS
ncbi:MAG: hypothetical protein HOI95_28365 [Chromatiales bacterium]|jgi:twitching motility protein PilI|nr:hypothetical protein [Chromatiales bacterium]